MSTELKPFRLEKFRVGYSEPAGYVLLEMAQNDGVGCQFSMSAPMAQQIIKALQEKISETKGKLN